MMQFDKCCFCVPLRTGCFILGYLHLVAAIIIAIISIVSLAAVGAAMANNDAQVHYSQVEAAIAVTVIVLLLVIILLTFSALLVVGLHKERKNYVKAFLIYYLVFIILYTLMYVVRLATLPFDLGYTLATLAEIVLSVYFLLVIRSYWVTMRENNFNTA